MPVSISLDDKIATDIVIPSTVTNIKDYAFYQCDDLKKVVISYSVTSIGKFAFRGCTSIESIKLSNKLSSIGYGAFSNCSRLINVGLPNSLKTIGDGTFYGCSTLTDIAFPSSLENIIASDGYPVLGISSIFSGCDKLAHIDIPDSVPITTGLNLSDTAYYKNEDNWIDGVLYIGNHLIECKKDIEGDVYIKDGTLYIHCGSFENRDNLKNVTVPGSVVSIGSVRASGPAGVSGAFAYCDSLETVTLNNGIKKIGMLTFKDCDNLKNIIIPDSVIEIYDYAFAECDNLESAAIGRGVQKIGYQMFANCSHLKSVSFTDSVTEIAFYAFSECNNLKDVYFAGSEDQWKLIKIQKLVIIKF